MHGTGGHAEIANKTIWFHERTSQTDFLKNENDPLSRVLYGDYFFLSQYYDKNYTMLT